MPHGGSSGTAGLAQTATQPAADAGARMGRRLVRPMVRDVADFARGTLVPGFA